MHFTALRCFKEQRYKINASNSQRVYASQDDAMRCFKEQRYKINASNSQRKRAEAVIQRNLQQAAQDIIRLKQ